MKNKSFLNYILRTTLIGFFLLALFPYISAQSSGSIVLNMAGQNMNFLNSNRTVLVDAGNNGTAAGSVHRYDNLLVANGITVWGKLTIKQSSNATITNFDNDTPGAGTPGRFQPWITFTGTNGYVLYELEFFEVITDLKVYISDYYVTGIDIDGLDANTRETVEIGGYSSYEVDNDCQLEISHNASTGRTKFMGISSIINDITFENTAAFIARYNFPYTKVEFALGNTGSATDRQSSLQFGTVGGVFTTPLSTYNPKRLLNITKTANTNAFKAGTNNKYTITLENVGAVAKNVTLKDTLPAGLVYVPKSTTITIPAANVIESLLDNFNLTPADYGVSNGTVLWKTNWAETNDNNNPANGTISITGTPGRLRFNNLQNNSSISRSFDLSELGPSDGATLSFSYVENMTSGSILAQISSNGSTYTTLGTYNSSSGSSTSSFSIPNTNFTSNASIRFINSSGGAVAGTLDIDNVKIDYSYYKAQQILHNNTGGTLLNGVTPNLLLSADNITIQPGVTATLTFDVSVDCNAKDSIKNTAYATCTDMYTSFVRASHVATVNPTTIGASGCTSGNILLTATGASPNQNYKWYNAATGGTLLQTNGSTYTALNVNTTTDYYVSYYNTTTGCESGRSKVTATISSGAPVGTAVISTTSSQNGNGNNTVPKNAGAAVNNNSSGAIAWVNPANAIGSNNVWATATLSGTNPNSQNLDLTNFGLAIPAGSNIVGVTASIERSRATGNTREVRDLVVQLLKNSAVIGNNKANTGTNWPTTEASASYGTGTTDLWGATLTPAVLNSTDFGIRIQARRNSGNPKAQVDNVTITVYYTTFGDDQSGVRFTTTAVSGATSYNWTVPTGATITGGQGTQTIFVNFNNAVATGTQTVSVQPVNTCGNGTTQNFTIGVTDNINREISGTVYYDPDGSSNTGTSIPPFSRNKVDGTPISSIAGDPLYAILVNGTTTIESKPIESDGTYKFTNLLATAGYYQVWISTIPYGQGQTPTAVLPSGATFNGEINNNAGNTTTGNTAPTDGKVLNLTASDPTESNVNFGIIVNNPVANNDAVTTNEDTSVTFNVTSNDTDPNSNINVATVDLDTETAGRQTTYTDEFGTWTVDNAGVVTYTPALDYYGLATLDYTIKDATGYESNVATITYTVNPVNDIPSFTKGSNITISEDAGPQSITNWATAISKGPSNESLQTIWFTTTNDNNSLFAVQPYIDAAGNLVYTPQPNMSGTTTVSVLINDDGGTANGGVNKSAIQTFTITINPVNDPPVAINDVNTTFINKPISGQVLTNDSDPEGGTLTVTTQTNVTTPHGTVTVNANGTYTFTPTTGYTGEDTFSYSVCDNGSPIKCSTATVTIEVIPIPTPSNDAPVAVNDNYLGAINLNISGKILANDFDPDGQGLTVQSALVATGNDGLVNDVLTLGASTAVYGVNDAGTKVIAGNLTLISDGTFTFVPTNGFTGTVTYTYLNTDGALTDDATVTLKITDVPGSNSIKAINDATSTPKNTVVTGNVLFNDFDPDNNTMTVSSPGTYNTVGVGSIVINTNGSYTFTPANNFVGDYTYTYTVCDNGTPQACSTATLTVTIYPTPIVGNDPPIAVNDSYRGNVNTTLTGNLRSNDLDPDGDNLTVTSALIAFNSDGVIDDGLALGNTSTVVYGINESGSNVIAGSLKVFINGDFEFVPTPGFTGVVNYNYTISDGNGGSDSANVKLYIVGANTTVAVDDSFYGNENTTINGNVKTNDYDPKGLIQTVNTTAVVAPLNGTLTLFANGTFNYIPNPNFSGTDQFVYTTCNNGNPTACDQATVYLNVNPINDPPIAVNDINSTYINTPVNGKVLTNDSDPEGDPLTVTVQTNVTTSAGGKVTISADGTYTFTPKTGYTGEDTFTYSVCDNGSPIKCSTATVSIQVVPLVQPGNNPPTAQNDVNVTEINTTIISNVISNDSDPDKDALTITSATGLTLGSATTVAGKDINGIVVANAGTVNLNASTGVYTYIPTTGFTGTVNDITYTISDGKGGTDTAILSISVIYNFGNNTFANDDANSAPKGINMTGNILTNDFDPEGNTQTVSSASALFGGVTTTITIGSTTTIPNVGTLNLSSTGVYTFVPLSTFVGTVPVKYNKCDNGSPQACDEATLYLTSIPIIVFADNDINQTPVNTPVSGQVLTNDEGVTTVSAATIGVSPFVLGTAKQVSGKDKGGTVVANAGMLTINADGTYTLTPSTGFVGTIDPITYTGAGAGGATDNAVLSIEVVPQVQPLNNPPTAQNDVNTTEINTTINSTVLSNDSDPDGDALTVTAAVGLTINTATTVSGKDVYGTAVPNAGTVKLNTDGTYTYVPATGFTGTVNDITYTISDGKGGTDTAILSLSVISNFGNNTFANDDAKSAPKGVTMTGNILTNDFDPEGNTQTVSSASALYNATTTVIAIGSATVISNVGTLTINSNGTYTFVPLTSFVGTVPVKYNKCDNGSPVACDEATLYLTSLPQIQVWVGTTNDVWNTAINWKSNFVPTDGDDVVFATEANNPTVGGVQSSGPAKNDLIVTGGATKTVGNLTNNSTKALVIPPGTAVIVNKEVINFDVPEKLVINADNDPSDGLTPNGSFVAKNLASCSTTTIMATIQLYAKGKMGTQYNWTDNIAGSPTFGTNFTGKYSWQFFGVPVQSIVAEPTFYRGFLREYDESKNAANSYYNKWIDLENSSVLSAFKGYEVTQDNPTIYEIKGKMMLCDQEITLTRKAVTVTGSTDPNIENVRYGLGQNVVGNSFAAAIPIDQIDFNTVKYDGVVVDNTSGTYVEKTVYLYNTGSFGEWTTGTSNTEIATAGTYRAIPSNVAGAVYTQIPSMNGFLLRHLKADVPAVGTGKDIKMTLPYNKLIKNDKPQTAPKAQLSYLEIHLKGSSTMDQLWLFSQAGTSSAFDNGWDGRKFFGRSAAYLYALSEAGNMQVNTTDNLIGTRIAFVPDGSKSYEMTIRKSNLGEYSSLYLADLNTLAVTELKDELTTYQFTSTAKSGKDEQRFRIVANPDPNTWKDNVYLNAYSEGKNIYLSNWTNHVGNMSVYDMSGRKLVEMEIPALIDKIIPVNIERGAYVIQLIAGEHQFSTKCIIR